MSGICSLLGRQVRVRLLSRTALALALVALIALALGGVIDPLHSGALTMLPALALATIMLTRPYLGERAIARLRTRSSPRTTAVAIIGARLRPHAPLARGGRLIAAALAGRAPPLTRTG